MFSTICFLFTVFLGYLFGFRPYCLYAKWKTYHNEVVPFEFVLLPKGADLNSGETLAYAIDQMTFSDIYRASYLFDHFERISLWTYLRDNLV